MEEVKYPGFLDLRIRIRYISIVPIFRGYLKEKLYRKSVINPEYVVARIDVAVDLVAEHIQPKICDSM